MDDADCSDDMVCEAFGQRCADDVDLRCLAEESDSDCAARAAQIKAECDLVTDARCTPVWSVPCDADSSCGDGFRCVAQACEVIDDTCQGDDDCPGRWLCRTYDAGPCQGGPDCIDGQRQDRGCVPPIFQGNMDLDRKSTLDAGADEITGSPASTEGVSSKGGFGCSVAHGAPRSAPQPGGVGFLVTIFGAALLRRRNSQNRQAQQTAV